MNVDEIVKLTRRGLAEVLRSRAQEPSHAPPERRQAPRWPFPATIEIYSKEEPSKPSLASCRNLSETGLGMCCERYFEPESLLDLAVHLPEVTFCGRGVVRYCMHTPKGFMTGVEFVFEE